MTGVQADAVTGQLPSGHALEAAMAAQHREVAALQAQMAMLSHDMTALRQSSSASRAPQLPSFKQVPTVCSMHANAAHIHVVCAYLAGEASSHLAQRCGF